MNKKDNIFQKDRKAGAFEFNETVASVFDDMIHRSVPFYDEIVLQQARLTLKFYREGTSIYDLGCSNGNYAATLLSEMDGRNFSLIAVDNSISMIELFKKRIGAYGAENKIEAVTSDIRDVKFKKSSVIISNLTLQFIPIEDRLLLMKKIYDALVPGGIFLITEKTVNIDRDLKDLQQEFYYKFKEDNDYSTIEITRKREALENVLIPETVESHLEKMNSAGFTSIEIWLKWFHFTAFLCRKD